jgi:hypothetical protein
MALQFSMEGTVKKVSLELLSASYAMVSIALTRHLFSHFSGFDAHVWNVTGGIRCVDWVNAMLVVL